MRIGLKVDVATLRGTREGVPALVELFRRHGVGAMFFLAGAGSRVLRCTQGSLAAASGCWGN